MTLALFPVACILTVLASIAAHMVCRYVHWRLIRRRNRAWKARSAWNYYENRDTQAYFNRCMRQ